MRIPDVSLLINAENSDSPHHEQALSWLEGALSGEEPVGFPVASLLGYVRITTQPRLLPNAQSAREALDRVDEWLEQPPARVVHPGRRHLGLCRELLLETGTAGNITSDAHLAAIAIELSATLASFDSDFYRFAGLKLEFLR